PDNRYLPNVQAKDIHYTAIGNASIAEKAFLHYQLPGANYDQSVNDFELIANAGFSYTSTNLSKLSITLSNNGGIFQKLTRNSSAGIIPTYSWVADPSTLYRDSADSIPSPRFRLNKFDNTKDQEIIFRMAHDGDESTKPGIVVRGSHAAGNSQNADFLTGILVQVRKGGKQITVFLRKNSEWVSQENSPITTFSSIENNQLVWYRVKIVAKTLTIDICNQDKSVKESAPPLEINWTNIYKVNNDDFPDAGQTWFTLYNGLTSPNGPYAAHFHMPVLISNKLME
ncbi:hypothetical protein, partial [Enterobacter kobei]|uniref:hypothetical protein n=1 Tax=Enterobacter kobei TaxID=208224 RepID=UPI003CF8895A